MRCAPVEDYVGDILAALKAEMAALRNEIAVARRLDEVTARSQCRARTSR